VATRLGHNNGVVARSLATLLRPFFRTAARGAETSVWLASSPDLDGVSGRYFVDRAPKRTSAATYDEGTARRLWDVSMQLTGLDDSLVPGPA
jgi:hypothetical protein